MKKNTDEIIIDSKEADVEIISEGKQHLDDRNEATVIGTLIKISKGDTRSSLTVLTSAGINRDIASFVRVSIPTELLTDNITEKSRVTIKGELRSRPVFRNGKDAKPDYEAYVDAKDISLTKGEMEETFGIKGRDYGPSKNRVILVGTVAKMFQVNRNTARITVTTKTDNGKPRFIETVFYARSNLKKFLPVIAAGNRICAIAEIQNYKKDPAKHYTVSGKTILRKEENPEEKLNPIYVKNVVLLDVKEF